MEMGTQKDKVYDLLAAAHLHKPARALYRAVFGAEGRARRRRLHDFYAPLIQKDDLVYDVGANIGVYSEIFCSLGARVIALEPIPDCVRHLKRWLPAEQVTVIEASVGAAPGTGRLHLSSLQSSSSMSDNWVETVKQSSLSKTVRWIRDLEVRVVTLDEISKQYGRPRYVKIDVEGYEEFVLDGMPWQPDLLSFEFHKETIEAAVRCLSRPCISNESLFNYLLGEPGRFVCEQWISFDQLKSELSALGSEHGFGDIFIRKP